MLDLQEQITDNKDDIHGLSTILSTQVQNFETTFIDKDKKSYAKLSSSNLILTDTVKKDPETYEKAKYYMSLEQGTIVLKPIY